MSSSSDVLASSWLFLTLDRIEGERMQGMLAKLHDYPRDIVEMATQPSD